MAKPATKEDIKKSARRWQSDVIVDMIKRYGFEYTSRVADGVNPRSLLNEHKRGSTGKPVSLCLHRDTVRRW